MHGAVYDTLFGTGDSPAQCFPFWQTLGINIMKVRFLVPLSVLSLAVFALSQFVMRAAAAAGDGSLTVASAVTSAVALQSAQAEYVGSSKCKKCHLPEFKSWEKLKHGNALETLKPGQASEMKTKFGLDLAKDYTADPNCVQCHVTGFNQPGGFQMGGDEKANKNLINVGCESCHGPGGAYLEHHEKVMKEKLTYTHEEMYAQGLNKIIKETCTKCHNEKSPTFEKGTEFNFEEEVKVGVHEHSGLKQLKQ